MYTVARLTFACSEGVPSHLSDSILREHPNIPRDQRILDNARASFPVFGGTLAVADVT